MINGSYKPEDVSRVALSDLELAQLDKIVEAGDHGALYYEMTGTRDALMMGKLSTFNETVRGIALAANVTSTYPGIFFLSQRIAEQIHENSKVDVNAGCSGVLSRSHRVRHTAHRSMAISAAAHARSSCMSNSCVRKRRLRPQAGHCLATGCPTRAQILVRLDRSAKNPQHTEQTVAHR